MFKLAISDTFRWPVSYEYPTDGQKQKKDTFDAIFKRLPQSRVNEIIGLAEKDEITTRDIAMEILVGWTDVTDEQGEQIQFSSSTRDQLLEISGMSRSIVDTYFLAINGSGKRKNS